MTEQNWSPLFRAAGATVTKALRSPAFVASRERAVHIIGDPAALRALADVVETMPHTNSPLSAIADRVAAATRFLHARADHLEGDDPPSDPGSPTSATNTSEAPPEAVVSAHERLVVAALHYLITPVDLVPDFRAGGYIDDVLLLSWVFGVAENEVDPFLTNDPAAEDETDA